MLSDRIHSQGHQLKTEWLKQTAVVGAVWPSDVPGIFVSLAQGSKLGEPVTNWLSSHGEHKVGVREAWTPPLHRRNGRWEREKWGFTWWGILSREQRASRRRVMLEKTKIVPIFYSRSGRAWRRSETNSNHWRVGMLLVLSICQSQISMFQQPQMSVHWVVRQMFAPVLNRYKWFFLLWFPKFSMVTVYMVFALY